MTSVEPSMVPALVEPAAALIPDYDEVGPDLDLHVDPACESAERIRRRWFSARNAVSALLLVGLAVGVVLKRDLIVDAGAEIRSLHPWVIAAVIGMWLVESGTRAGVYRAASPSMSWPQSVMMNEVSLAAGNGLPLGPAVGLGMRFAMGRSFGHSSAENTVAYLAAGEGFALGRWIPMLAVAVGDLTFGSGGSLEWWVVAASCVAITSSAIGATVLCTSTWISRFAVGVLEWIRRRVGRRVRFVERFDLTHFSGEVRDVAGAWIRVRGINLVLWGLAAQLINGLIFLVALRGAGIGSEVTAFEFWGAFFLVKTLSRFVPTPGGVGAVELGLAATLVSAGAAETPAVAAILVYRGVTFLLPIITGSIAFLAWRRWTKRVYVSAL
jgi:putative heme transporter